MSLFYHTVPKDREANLRWRSEQCARAAADPDYQETLREMCKRDLLFWINGFGWLAEQRAREGAPVPFITFPVQDDALLRMEAALGHKIVVGDKSRDVGFSWMVLYLFAWRWVFFPLQSFAIASRSEKYVDQRGNPDSLFWKLDYLMDHLPTWMLPDGFDLSSDRFRTKNHLCNTANGSDITGYATGPDIGRGGRRLAVLLDELGAWFHADGQGAWASCQDVTESIFAVSTHQGTTGAFAEACAAAAAHPEEYEHIVIRWWNDPRKNEGLCTVDPANPAPGMSKWTLENRVGQPWSPWHEKKCKRLKYNKKHIAEEVDGDPSTAGHGFFSKFQLDDAAKYCRPPRRVGRLVYDAETLEPIKFVDDPEGNLSIWCPMVGERPVMDDYSAGCDISAGVGSTPSCINLASMRTGEKAAEYADSKKPPREFACEAIAVAKWFFGAKLIWETPGPGAVFSKTIRLRGYRNLYRRRTNEGDLVPGMTDHIGWSPSPDLKRDLLEEFRDALGVAYLERSKLVLEECKDYRYGIDGNVEQSKARETDDPTKARHNHGDRVIAAALSWKVIKEGHLLVAEPEREAPKQIAMPGSMAWLMEQEKALKANEEFEGSLRL